MTARADGARGAPSNREYAIDLMRAFGGAVIFAFPLLMTMEMWWLGFYIDPLRLLVFLALNLAILFGLSCFAGFRETFHLKEDALDAFAAYGVGTISSAVLLTLFGIITWDMPPGEIAGKIAVQSVPASIGAMAARSQLGDNEDDEKGTEGYAGQLFLMLAGALFLAFNVAPTEEMIVISFLMTPWHGLALVVVSLLVLHAFVYSLDFSGQEELPGDGGFWRTFFGYSIAGYGIALLVSLYVLWTFGRLDGLGVGQIAMMTAVLGFPSALGAALARLVV
ncbi:TIGR02587 family membrane protein [Paracoccus benzoatiresistens]|uniref:TIGR02587 family membrane protein n=1 Tax=Paracoccus benzoatiresistens TaxID=2997341 RepID=A0ABT4J623_9RHOB|nr:TIGR02587 family membrane protein [Paracoccus sp. EF6]MCZ0962364.1 TIGR02587 family membrane protein [Paracoccus sp. EF6]